jgi:periplasmic protein CpxP/Spy
MLEPSKVDDVNHDREVNMGRLSTIKKVAISIALAVAIAAPFALAQQADKGEAIQKDRSGWRGKRGGDRRGGFLFGNLDLTDAQKAQLEQIREANQQTLLPLMKQMRAKRQEIHQASQGGAFNEALVTQKLTEIAPLEAKLMGERFRLHKEMLSVLTPEQKAKLDQSREQMKARRGERGARRGR